ncbi:hypothetical protein FACS1894218_1880 [Bacilli bacterium]|nr:hypothetical protein FACS1894218_1880 [Bacilli bacterium]
MQINGYQETIKKEQILEIYQKSSITGLESRGIKFYIIQGIEYATPQSVNSLLKMLEEPPLNTYAILTTRSLNLIIPTIKSRCQVFTLKSNLAPLNDIAAQYNLDSTQIALIKNVYYSYDELNDDLQSQSFFELYELGQSLVNNNGNLQVIKRLYDEFKKMDYKQIASLLKFLNYMSHGSPTILEIMENIKINPIKTLMFNKIISQFGNE